MSKGGRVLWTKYIDTHFLLSDARWTKFQQYTGGGNTETGIVGHLKNPTRTVTHAETPVPHGQGYNMLFCDGHVSLVKRNDYLFPPRSARHWNRDNQPHPEAWAQQSEWMVQQ